MAGHASEHTWNILWCQPYWERPQRPPNAHMEVRTDAMPKATAGNLHISALGVRNRSNPVTSTKHLKTALKSDAGA